MRKLTNEIRLLIAEKILGLILKIVPKNHNSGNKLIILIHDYFQSL